MQLSPMGLRWRRMVVGGDLNLSSKVERRLDRILQSWQDTPYQHGQCVKGVGVDCSHLLAAVLDEAYHRPVETALPEYASDGAMHDKEGAMRALKGFLRRYPNHHELVEDGWTEPGDTLIVGPTNGGPGHAMIVGPQENTVWHAPGPGCCVCFTGLFLPEKYQRLFAVYRMSDRHLWA